MDGMQPKIPCFINQLYLCPRFFYSLILTESQIKGPEIHLQTAGSKNIYKIWHDLILLS